MKIAFSLTFLLALSYSVGYADSIEENFNRGSAMFGISPYGYYRESTGYWRAGAEAQLDFLIRDDFTMGGRVLLHYLDYDVQSVFFRLTYVLSYIFGYKSEATHGPVHRIGVRLENSNMFTGAEYEVRGAIKPFYTFLYFFTPRIAPYVETSMEFAEFIGGDDFTFLWGPDKPIGAWFQVEILSVTVGVSFYIPKH